MMRLLTILLILGVAQFLPAQQPSLRFECQPDSVQLGTAFKCGCTLSLPQGASLRSLLLPLDSIKTLQGMTEGADTLKADYEITDYGSWQSAKKNQFSAEDLNWQANTQNGFDIYFNTINLVIWQPGIFQIPAIIADVNWNNAGYEVSSDPQFLKVDLPIPVANVDSTGLAPIKSIVLTERSWAWLYWTIGLGLLALAGAYGIWYYFFRNRKGPLVEEKIEIIPAHIKAFQALAKIEKQEDWLKGELKKYYDELTHVLREYLEDRYDIPALESTTDEILNDLIKTDVPEKFKSDMQRLLPMSDMVKFAKAMPHEEQHRGWLTWMKELATKTKLEIITPEENENAGE